MALALASQDEGLDDDSDNEQLLDERPEEIGEKDPEKVLDICKKRIKKLTEERERKTEYHERLEKKLRKLESELAKSRQEVEQTNRQLTMLRTKGEEDQRKTRLESSKIAKRQEEHIRENLSEVLYTKPRNAPGKGAFELDTVKVAYKKDPSSMVWYNLQFRCDKTTTVKQLRKNVCNYWEIKDQDYILKTMANNKCNEDIELQDCFKNGEIAMLRLERKNQKNAEPPSEDELKAIQAKNPGKARKKPGGGGQEGYNPSKAAAQVHGSQDNFRPQLEKMGGTYFLLRMQEDKPTEHVSKIKLIDIIVYTAMLIATFTVYTTRRPERVEYSFHRSIEEQMLSTSYYDAAAMPDSNQLFNSNIPSFKELKTRDELWDWLSGTLPSVIWDTSNTSMGMYNLLLGYFQIRVQSISGSACEFDNTNFVSQLGQNAGCYGLLNYGTMEAKDTMELVKEYWENVTTSSGSVTGVTDGVEVTDNLRGPGNPGIWINSTYNNKHHNIGSLTGSLMTYDASGYSVNYRMLLDQISEAPTKYKQDMTNFKNLGWIDAQTRVVIISFTLYNFHYDLWMAVDLIAELPSSGALVTSYHFRPFTQRKDETEKELQETYVDWLRACGALYIFFYVGYAERRHKTRNHKAGFKYHISLNGITDWGIVICVFVAVMWRWIDFQGNDTTADYIMKTHDQDGGIGFTSYSTKAKAYESLFVVEGFLMVFLSYRMISFFRLNATVYLLCHALGRAFWEFVYFSLIFFPFLFGVFLYLQKMYGPYIDGFDHLDSTVIQVYRLLEGNLDVGQLVDLEPLRSVVLLVLFYIVFTFFCMNVFVTIVVDAYYVTRLTSIPGPSWSMSKWIQWAMPSLCYQLVQAANQWSVKPEGTEGTA